MQSNDQAFRDVFHHFASYFAAESAHTFHRNLTAFKSLKRFKQASGEKAEDEDMVECETTSVRLSSDFHLRPQRQVSLTLTSGLNIRVSDTNHLRHLPINFGADPSFIVKVFRNKERIYETYKFVQNDFNMIKVQMARNLLKWAQIYAVEVKAHLVCQGLALNAHEQAMLDEVWKDQSETN